MLPSVRFRRSPEDFIVEELPLYPACGRGEHLFVTFTKRDLTTPDAVHAIARALGVDARAAGWAGLKDRHAVTTQTVSFGFPMARDADEAVARIDVPGVTVLRAARHENKLKPGHLLGNRFQIRLVDVAPEDAPSIVAKLEEAGATGVPNAFGPQRFGRDGDNPARALAWLQHKERGPRNPRDQRFLFSSIQSLLFNKLLELREADGSWDQVLPGDVAKKHDTGGLFDVALEGPELDDARARAAAGGICATGPMFGSKMRWPSGRPLELERDVLEQAGLVGVLEGSRLAGEGTRRPLRLLVSSMRARFEELDELDARHERGERGEREASTGRAVVVAEFVLPKGGYATTVLGRACRLIDAARHADPAGEAGDAREDP